MDGLQIHEPEPDGALHEGEHREANQTAGTAQKMHPDRTTVHCLLCLTLNMMCYATVQFILD